MPLNQADIDAFFTTRAGSSSKSASSPLRAPPRATSGTQTQRTPWTIAKANTGRQANGASSTTPTRTRNTNGGNTTSSRRSNGGASLSRYAATVGTQHRRVQHTAARPQYSSEDSGESSGSDINDIKLSPTQMPVARRGRRVVSDSDEASDSEAKAGGPSNADDPDDSDDGLRLSTDGNGQGKRKAASSDGSDSAAPRRTRRRARQADPDASELEEEDNLTRPRRKPTTPRLTRSRAAKTNDSVKVEDDSDVVEVTPAPTRARKNSARRSDRRRQADPDDSEDFIVSDEEATPPRSRRKRTSTSGGGSYRRQHDTDDDDTDVFIVSDGQVTPVRSRRKSKSTPGSSARRRIVDPDEESDDSAQTEDEAPDALELDQPERFATATRLRQRRETDRQRLLRKLKNKRLNIVSSGSEEDEGNGNDGYDYANGSGDEAVDREGSGSFIADDDDDEAFDANLLPSEFSLGYAQSREYKFKVVFQYLLLLVIHGPGVLPLRGAQKEYMAPVAELRDYVRGIRNLRVRSQIWRADFVKAMETYPLFQVSCGKV